MYSYTMEWFLIAVTILFVVSVLLNNARHNRCRVRQRLGLEWLTSMAQLLSHVQQHRGLSNGFLNGSLQLAKEIDPLQLRIKRDLSDIQSLSNWVVSNERWLNITDHWQRLSSSYKHKLPESCLREHNVLIQSILFLIDDMAQAHDLLLLGRGDQPLQLLWRNLLTATEYIGQARAIGTGLSATGSCDSVSRIRLNYLCQKIISHTEIVWKELSLDSSKRNSITALVNCIRDHVVKDKVSIAPTEYFEIASRAINSLLDQYQSKIDQQREQLGK